MSKETYTDTKPDIKRIRRLVGIRFVLAFVAWGTILFLTAGTLSYWEAWVVIAIFSVSMGLVLSYFLRHDPALLERRMRYKEKETEQKRIVKFGSIVYLIAFLLPGFDKRYGWSEMSWGVVAIADLLILAAYSLFFWVMKVNRFASRVVEVEQDQHVVTTGPYAYVRHPMYVAVSIIYLFLPIALGSYWALLPAFLLPLIIVLRIKNEEEILIEQLKGYSEYVKSVKHRLIPGLWVPI